MRLPEKIEDVHGDWVRGGLTGVIELHYQNGVVRAVHVRASLRMNGEDQVPDNGHMPLRAVGALAPRA